MGWERLLCYLAHLFGYPPTLIFIFLNCYRQVEGTIETNLMTQLQAAPGCLEGTGSKTN